MKTGSLRTRVTLTTLVVLAIVLAVVVTTVTLAYRAKLDGDLRARVTHAGAAVERAGSAAGGEAAHSRSRSRGDRHSLRRIPRHRPTKTSSTVQTHGSLLTLDVVLPDRTRVVFSASRASIDHAVTDLLLVEFLVAAAALRSR